MLLHAFLWNENTLVFSNHGRTHASAHSVLYYYPVCFRTKNDTDRRIFVGAFYIAVECFQSNHEGAIIDAIQEADGMFDGIVINPGAYAHYSYAIRDAIKAITVPVVEVHISDIEKREEFRHLSVTAPVCIAQIRGHGFESYTMGIDLLAGAKQ